MTTRLNRFPLVALAMIGVVAAATSLAAETKEDDSKKEDEEGFVSLFNGKEFGDWKINESKESWSIKDGAIVAQGPRSHIFYMGKDNKFKNFELKVDVMTKPGSNGGIFFHTKWQDDNWPRHGYECQVNVSQGDPVKTGSIYNTVKLYKDDIDGLIKDNQWWTQHIIVRGKHITVKLKGKKVLGYTEPDDKRSGQTQ